MAASSDSRALEHRSGWVYLTAWVAAILFASLCLPVLAQVTVSVPGTANPYLSGLPGGSACCSGDSAPAQSPVQVTGLTLTPGSALTFSATGSVDFQGSPPTDSPDGGFIFSTSSTNGISGATWPSNTLVGVFLDNSLPTSSPAPADLDFSAGAGTSFATLSPALKQVFFIGDGLTGTGTGTVQRFIIPAGATRLFIGLSDGFGWFNNVGSFSVTVTPVAAPPPPPTAAPANVPTLSLPMLVAMSLALAAIAAVILIRRS